MSLLTCKAAVRACNHACAHIICWSTAIDATVWICTAHLRYLCIYLSKEQRWHLNIKEKVESWVTYWSITDGDLWNSTMHWLLWPHSHTGGIWYSWPGWVFLTVHGKTQWHTVTNILISPPCCQCDPCFPLHTATRTLWLCDHTLS